MRVFVVCNRLCYGGAERVGVTITNGLFDRGYEVFVVADLFMPVTYELRAGVHMLNLYREGKGKYAKQLSSFTLLRTYLKQYHPDVVIGIMWLASLRALVAARGLLIPVISTVHDSFERPACAPMSRFEHFHKFVLNKLYDYVTVLTEADKRYIGKRLKHVTVMPNPLALTPVRFVADGQVVDKEDEETMKQPFILAAGRLDDWHCKGFDLLIKAWSLVEQKTDSVGRKWQLKIAGKDTPEALGYLKRLCQEYHVDGSVEFLGFRTDIDHLMQEASVFVLSSRYEGFGLVLIEAMSQGCACVAADYKGRQREIIGDESNGMLCPTEDAGSLAEKMQYLILHPEERMCIQRNAAERSKVFATERIIDRWDNYLQNVMSR